MSNNKLKEYNEYIFNTIIIIVIFNKIYSNEKI